MSKILQNFGGKAEGLALPDQRIMQIIGEISIDPRPFIDGISTDPLSDRTSQNTSPINSELILEVPDCQADDIDRGVQSARKSFESGVWSRASLQFRKNTLLNIASAIESNAEIFAALDCIDVGKPFGMAKAIDVAAAVETFRWYGELIDKVHGAIAPTNDLDLLLREPIGVVGAVTPWNYPIMIAAWKLAPILAAGNSVVLKPAEQSPMSALFLAKLVVEAGLPPGVLNVVPGEGQSAGKALGLHPDVDAIGFTGSTEVGKLFLQYSGQSNMKSVTLECGGKSPLIVFGDADASAAARAMASAVFYNAGQSCNAPARALIHISKKDEFLETLQGVCSDYHPNNPLSENTGVGSIVDGSQLGRIDGFVERSLEEGASLVCGGTPLHSPSDGFYYAPTILSDTSQKMEINQQEIFGPVVPVQDFSTDAEAIQLANDVEYGLWANVWTNDMSRTLHVSKSIRAGTVAFNTVWGGDITTPMGGYKQSGIGRDRGVEGLLKYTQIKHISLLPQG